MANIRLLEFDSFSIGAVGANFSGTEGTDYFKYDGILVDGREIDLPDSVDIKVDNNQSIPISQEASFLLPLLDGSDIKTANGSASSDHLVNHDTTIASKADIQLNGVAGSVNMKLTNVRISMSPKTIESEGETVVTDVIKAYTKGSFGSVVDITPVS